MANLVTIPDVELCSVGTWNLSTGERTFTVDDFAAAVAAQDDPAVRSPIVKLGHVDPRFDGEPAIGRVVNMRCSADGMTLIGDIAGVPKGIADIWGTAWPSRSIEGSSQFRTATGNTHDFVITALALLGTALPGIENLADIAALYDVAAASGEAGIPVTVTLTDQEAHMPAPKTTTKAAAGFTATTTCTDCAHKASAHNDRKDTGANSGACSMANCSCSKMAGVAASAADQTTPPASVKAAGVAVEDVRRAFYDGPAEQNWWWIRSIYIDPPELIVDDDDDSLLRVGYTVDPDGTITFADPVPVTIEYVDLADDGTVAASAAGQTVRPSPKRTFASRADSRPAPSPSASTSGPQGQNGDTVDLTKIRESLGLADDVSDDDVLAAAATKLAEPAPTPPAPAAETITEPAKPTPLPEGVVAIDEAALNDLKVAAAAGTQARERQRTDDRDRFLDGCVTAGKFPPARREFWASYYDRDPDGAKTFLDTVAAGSAIPLAEQGHPGTGEGQPDDMDREFAELSRLGSSVAADVVAKRSTNRKDA
ncbi:MAG: phage protease [Actinomycetota bacterium]|nr:phage protease [Actinomycetota bacterium]